MQFKKILVLVLPLLAATQIAAQMAPLPKKRHALNVSSKYLDNDTNTAKVVFTHTVRIAGANWTRLFFDKTNLPPGTKLHITGVQDRPSNCVCMAIGHCNSPTPPLDESQAAVPERIVALANLTRTISQKQLAVEELFAEGTLDT